MKLTLKFEDRDRLDNFLNAFPLEVKRFEITINLNGDIDVVFDDEFKGLVDHLLLRIYREQGSTLLLSINPPRLPQYLLLFIPKRHREHLVGDLEEEYGVILAQYGDRKARLWYWWQTISSILPYIIRFLKHSLGLAVLWKLIG